MTAVFILGVLAGLALLTVAWEREHARDVDAFAALDLMSVAGPLAMRPLFAASAVVSATSALLGLPSLAPMGRATVAVAMLIVTWLVWLAAWVDLRWLVDAAVVFQDHVPMRRRPALAFSHAPHAAWSFRPFMAALVLLAALGATGVGFGLLSRYFGWTRYLPALATTVWAAIGAGFVAYVRSAMSAERRVRLVLGDVAAASDEALFDALRRNPRSARLLVEHARRLERAGESLQALLEYRTAVLTGSLASESADGAIRTKRKLESGAGPIAGSIVRRRRSAEPRMELEPLQIVEDAIQVEVLDATRFVQELLALTDEDLILNVQGEVESSLAEELRAYEHLAPLIPDDQARPNIRGLSWRLTPEVRDVLRSRIVDASVPTGWINVTLHTLDRILVQARSHFALVLAAPDLVQREFIEWRRAAAVAPMRQDSEPAEQAQS